MCIKANWLSLSPDTLQSTATTGG